LIDLGQKRPIGYKQGVHEVDYITCINISLTKGGNHLSFSVRPAAAGIGTFLLALIFVLGIA